MDSWSYSCVAYKKSQRDQCEYTRSHFRFKHIWVQHVLHIQITQHLSLVFITLYPHLNMKRFDACNPTLNATSTLFECNFIICNLNDIWKQLEQCWKVVASVIVFMLDIEQLQNLFYSTMLCIKLVYSPTYFCWCYFNTCCRLIDEEFKNQVRVD